MCLVLFRCKADLLSKVVGIFEDFNFVEIATSKVSVKAVDDRLVCILFTFVNCMITQNLQHDFLELLTLAVMVNSEKKKYFIWLCTLVFHTKFIVVPLV